MNHLTNEDRKPKKMFKQKVAEVASNTLIDSAKESKSWCVFVGVGELEYPIDILKEGLDE